MADQRRLLFVLTDGGRARLLERSARNGHYETLEVIDGAPQLRALRDELRASPPARTMSSTSPRRSAVGPDHHLRTAKEAFVGQVARRAGEVCRREGFAGVVIAAPSQLIGPLKAGIEGHAELAGVIRKDLTKTPNGELGNWLNDAFVNPQFGR